jgi:septum formation protein
LKLPGQEFNLDGAMSANDPIVLASASPRRRAMLADLGIPFEVVPADVVEARRAGESPAAFATRTAREKGEAVAARLSDAGRTPWIVAADTVVVLGEEVLGKPRDAADARRMLTLLSGATHTVITGWTVGRHGGPWTAEHAATDVTFHTLTGAEVAAYAATGEGLDKAGAYAIQGVGTFLVDRIDGNYFNVVGLPVSHVVRALVAAGALEGFPLP